MNNKENVYINVTKLLFAKLNLDLFDFFPDRIEEKHLPPADNRLAGSAYRSLNVKDGTYELLYHIADCGQKTYAKTECLKKFKTLQEGLRYLFLYGAWKRFASGTGEAWEFVYNQRDTIFKLLKEEPAQTAMQSVKTALKLAGLPGDNCSLTGKENPRSVCLKIRDTEGIVIEYRNSQNELADQLKFEDILLESYEPERRKRAPGVPCPPKLLTLAVFETVRAGYTLHLWTQLIQTMNEGELNFFNITEADYGNYVLHNITDGERRKCLDLKTKKNMRMMDSILQKELIYEFRLFSDKIDDNLWYRRKKEYNCLDFSGEKPVYLIYADGAARLIKTYETSNEAIREWYLNALITHIGSYDIQGFRDKVCEWQKEAASKADKKSCLDLIKEELHEFKIPSRYYHFNEEADFGILYWEKADRYLLQYYNSAGEMTDKISCEQEHEAIGYMFEAVYKLYLLKKMLENELYQSKTVFHLEEKDYGTHLLRHLSEGAGSGL